MVLVLVWCDFFQALGIESSSTPITELYILGPFFEIGSHSVALAVLKLVICLPQVGIVNIPGAQVGFTLVLHTFCGLGQMYACVCHYGIIQKDFIALKIYIAYSALPQHLAIINLFIVSIVLPFSEYRKAGII